MVWYFLPSPFSLPLPIFLVFFLGPCSLSLCFVPSQSSSEDQSENGAGVQGLGQDLDIWVDVCGLGVFGILKMLGGLEGTNRFAMSELAVGHVDVTVTRAVELDMVDGVGVVVVAAAVLGNEVDIVALGGKKGTSILTLYCLLLAWWFLILFLESLIFLFLGTCDFANDDLVGLSG